MSLFSGSLRCADHSMIAGGAACPERGEAPGRTVDLSQSAVTPEAPHAFLPCLAAVVASDPDLHHWTPPGRRAASSAAQLAPSAPGPWIITVRFSTRRRPRRRRGRRSSRVRHGCLNTRHCPTRSQAIAKRSNLTTFRRLDEFGLIVTGQRLEPDRAVPACRVVEPDQWCRRCGCEGVPRDTVVG